MNLSLQITNPKFLSDDFTTRLDLITGKLYYHSEWGELVSMLSPEIVENISRSNFWQDILAKNWKPEPITRPRLKQIRDNQTPNQSLRRFLRYDGEIEARDPYDLWVDLYNHTYLNPGKCLKDSEEKEQVKVKRGFKGKVMKMIQANEYLNHNLKHTFLDGQGNCLIGFSHKTGWERRLRIDAGHGYNWEDPLGE